MFYSHEVLTSRQHGVATVWLVATLGAKSTLKRVSRRAILDVDVAKACETIAQPEAPMALRLQSNLLYGVTRVYSQQCGYILTDAESARNSMRIMMRAMRQQVDLDKERAHKANPEHFVLQDDPNFLPDLDLMPIDLDMRLGLLDDESQSTLSPHSSQLTHATLQSADGLMLPPSQSSLLGDPVGGGLDILSVRGDSGASLRLEGRLLHDDDDLGLDIDKVDDEPVRQPRGPSGSINRTDIVSNGVRAGTLDDNCQSMFDPGAGDMPMQDDSMVASEEVAAGQEKGTAGQPKNQEEEQETTSESASAPLQKTRQRSKKPILQDREISLRSSAVKNWQEGYLEKMREVMLQKQGPKLAAIAKKNAAHWVLGTGRPLGQGMLRPLDIFSGAGLVEAFTGISLLDKGRKRGREEADASQDSTRRVRARGEPSSNEAGRGLQDDGLQDNGFIPDQNMDDTIEYGREAPTPLDDRQLSSVFPWNQSAGSRRPTDVHLTSGSMGGGMGPHLNFFGRRGSRLTSASPLIGRGTVGDDGSDLYPPGSDNGMVGLNGDEDFELYGAAAQVDTQTAAQSQWQRAALGTESANFFTFVQNAISGADLPDDEDGADMIDSMDFESLLPPATNSKIVAAQAFLHLLTLGNKKLFRIQQDEAFGPITMHIVAAA